MTFHDVIQVDVIMEKEEVQLLTWDRSCYDETQDEAGVLTLSRIVLN